MTGYVDELLRAWLEVRIRRLPSDEPAGVTVWIDTAFNGHLVFRFSFNRHGNPSGNLQPAVICHVPAGTGTPV